MSTAYLKPLQPDFINSCFTTREGEKRLGECVQYATAENYTKALANPSIRFVLIGIPEDLGVRANYGLDGTSTFWPAFLKTFLSIQANNFLYGETILIAGEVLCDDLMENCTNETVENLSGRVETLDVRVTTVLQSIFAAGKIAVVIGGGHNNAYPLLQAAHLHFGKKISVVNIDPHADLRKTDRRHSGNGFSYAKQENLLLQYLQVGLHESYNNQFILDQYSTENALLHYFSYDNYLDEKWNFADLNTYVQQHFKNCICGFELDADSILNMPSSAATPSGFSVAETRQLVKQITRATNPVYFHFPEAIAGSTPVNSTKLAAYLITDFIKAR